MRNLGQTFQAGELTGAKLHGLVKEWQRGECLLSTVSNRGDTEREAIGSTCGRLHPECTDL